MSLSSRLFFFTLVLITLGVSLLDYPRDRVQARETDLYQRPTRGGTERGIPGLARDRRGASPIKYLVAVYGKKTLQPTLPTHVVATGHGGNVGTLFQEAAASRGKKLAELFPGHQIMLITVNELDGNADMDMLRSWGYQVVGRRKDMLSVAGLLSELQPLTQIASFDLFAHSNDYNGAALDADFLAAESSEVSVLKPQFTADAWASLYGCNSGWELAPALVGYWNIPVSGGLTGTFFERLHSTGYFFPYDELLAPEGPFASHNPYSFNRDVRCETSGCTRMHPDSAPYDGEWGRRPSGLGFYKFFCGPIDKSDCERRMALSLAGYIGITNLKPSSAPSKFLTILKEYMCPISRFRDALGACSEGIDRALRTGDERYTPFLGKSPICSAGICREPKKGEVSKEFMRSVRAFIRGFQTLKSPPPSPKPGKNVGYKAAARPIH